MNEIAFSIPEVLALLGMTQCVYLLVYMVFRAGRISRAGLPIVYFLILGFAFLSDFADKHISGFSDYYFYGQWALWFAGPPLSVLLIIQIAKIDRTPDLKFYAVLLLLPLAFGLALAAVSGVEGCTINSPCPELHEWLTITGLIAGAVSLLTIWMVRGLFPDVQTQKTGKSRYWLILSLIFMNVMFLTLMLASFSPEITEEQVVLMRNVLGLGLIYLVNTSLFRIYPQAVTVIPQGKTNGLSAEEMKIATKIDKLMTFEKVYQEASYSRASLAQECGASEAVISRVINIYFDKSFPQLLNERRVADARRLLEETDANIKTIAEEVGFNSLASFNRVFKEITGRAPSEYRKEAA